MIGVVADDITGANDIGLMFNKNQYKVKIVSYSENLDLEADSDVLVINTDSRLDEPKTSYNKVFNATKALQKIGCSVFYNKTCSVFRGNIGKEFDAMLDALDENFAVISLAFPKNGRKTINGIHTVNGKRLEESEFANDPVHPMRQSDLVEILKEQTDRSVSLVNIDIVRQGHQILKDAILEARKKSNYCIVDSENQDDLTVLAQAIKGFPVLCGSSAIAEELPKFWGTKQAINVFENFDMTDDNGVLVVSGSLTPQTKNQTDYLISSGLPVFVLDSRKIFVKSERKKELTRVTEKGKEFLKQGKDVLIMADNKKEVVSQTKETGAKYNMDPLTISRLVSTALADVTENVCRETGLKRLVVAGGDTSGAICRRLGIKGNYVLQEIETGLPIGLSIGREMLVVLKSGSFGKTEFLAKAIEQLKSVSKNKIKA